MPKAEPRDHDLIARYVGRIATRPRSVVVQPTSWCNLRCTYCYEPTRHLHNDMTADVAAAVAASIADLVEGRPGAPVTVIWHAGEPMGLGVDRTLRLLEPFERLRRAGVVQHAIQTNATMVTNRWCDLLDRYQVRVGVSIDGTKAMNAQRVDQHGRPAFDRIMRGIQRLRDHGIPFSVISVVGRESIDRPEELLNFVTTLGCHTIGINIEEFEGANTERQTPTREQATEFWQRVIAWSRTRPQGAPTVRELDQLGSYLGMIRTGGRAAWEKGRYDPIPTVAADGTVVLLSPELAGIKAPAYDDFRAGNVLQEPLADILARAPQLRYVQEFLSALDRCQASCQFFDKCRGSQAGNRFFEHGTFDASETRFCQVTEQALVHALSTTVREESAA